MAQFNLKLTKKGVLLLAQAAAGKTAIFQKMVMGDGYYSGDPAAVEAVISPKRELPIYRLVRNGQRVSVRSVLTLGEVAESFWWRELGLYAADPDTGAMVLAAYGNAQDKADYIAAGEVLDERILDVSFVVDTAADISADVSGVLFAGEEEFQTHQSNSAIHVTALTHSKTGTVHALTGLNGATGILSCQFKATAAFAAGDTLTVDGTSYAIKLTNGEDAEDNLFVSGAIVSCIVDASGKTVNFKAAGGAKLPAGTTAIVKIFTANGTFTVPQTGTYRITAIGKGGDGGGGYSKSSSAYYGGGGGGAGGLAISELKLIKDASYTVTVSSATSSFGSLLTAAAGQAGPRGSAEAVAATGGTASGGNILNANGENGTVTAGTGWTGGTGGGYSSSAVSACPYVVSSGGAGGNGSGSGLYYRDYAGKSVLTPAASGMVPYGVGGGGSGTYSSYAGMADEYGGTGNPGAVIIEMVLE